MLDFPGGASGKEPAFQRRRHKRHGFDPWVEKIPGGGNGFLLQYSCLGNLMVRRDWQATVHGIAKSWTRLKPLSRDTQSTHWRLGDKGPALVDVISQKTMWQLSKEIHTRRQRSAGLQGLLSDYVSGRRCEYSGPRLCHCADLEGEGRQFVPSFAVADDETFPVFFRLET